ncbi:hypothetical protein ACFLYU_02085 [Candidatus Dependentiae bacterium]
MLDNCKYDKVKLLHEMSSIAWFLEKHAKENANKADDKECFTIYQNMLQDLEKHIQVLKSTISKT